MFGVLAGIFTRIVSNSYANVYQKFLTKNGERPSRVNLFTYLGLSMCSLCLIPFFRINYSNQLLINFIIVGLLGALGNYFIIKALSIGELSSLAPINSYKPVVALILGFIYLGEKPSIFGLYGIILIILGTYVLYYNGKNFNKLAVLYRIFALICSGSEAVFIKKIILLTNVPSSFALWCFSGFIFSFIFYQLKSSNKIGINYSDLYLMLILILSVGIMQFSTNYVFSKINVAYALSIFQLSTVLSVFLGKSYFKEKGILRKSFASVIMIIGAVIILLFA